MRKGEVGRDRYAAMCMSSKWRGLDSDLCLEVGIGIEVGGRRSILEGVVGIDATY